MNAVQIPEALDFVSPPFLAMPFPVESVYDGAKDDDHSRFELIIDCDEQIAMLINEVGISSKYGERPRCLYAVGLEVKDLRLSRFALDHVGKEVDVRFTEYGRRGDELYCWGGRYVMVSAAPTLTQECSGWKFVLDNDALGVRTAW